MSRIALLPGERVLSSFRSYASLATFHATDRRLIRSSWRFLGRGTHDRPYERITSVIPEQKRNLNHIAITLLLSPALGIIFPVIPIVLVILAVRKKQVWRLGSSGSSEDKPGLWDLWGAKGLNLIQVMTKQSNGRLVVSEEAKPPSPSYPTHPGQPTLFERVLGAVPVPYAIACLGLVLGQLGSGFLRPEITESLGAQTFSAMGNFTALFMIRHMRVRLNASKGEFLGVCAEGIFAKTFGRLLHPLAPIAVGLVFSVGTGLFFWIFVPTSVPTEVAQVHELTRTSWLETAIQFSLLNTILNTILASLVSLLGALSLLGLGTFLWVYFYTLKGLYRLGKESLKLKNCMEDRMLGARVFGSLSFVLAAAYFATLGAHTTADILSPIVFLGSLPLIIAMFAFGIAMFLLPLWSIHTKMKQMKLEAQLSVRQRRLELSNSPRTPEWKLQWEALQIEEREVELAHMWPVDVRILARLAGIVAFLSACFNVTSFIVDSLTGR